MSRSLILEKLLYNTYKFEPDFMERYRYVAALAKFREEELTYALARFDLNVLHKNNLLGAHTFCYSFLER